MTQHYQATLQVGIGTITGTFWVHPLGVIHMDAVSPILLRSLPEHITWDQFTSAEDFIETLEQHDFTVERISDD
jgi:hypothetical protein